VADADEPGQDSPSNPDAVVSPLNITDVLPSQSCGGEWTASLSPSSDGRSVMALLGTDEDYEISISPDGITASRLSNCTLDIAVEAAAGISYALTKVSYEGRAILDEDVVAEQTVAYGFAGGATSPRVRQEWVGPMTGSAALDESFPPDRLVWSSCDKPSDLQVRTSLYLRNTDPQGSGSLSMSLASGVLMLVLEFTTRSCPVSGP